MTEFKELNKSAIGARIRKRRELLGLSREELAEQLGVTAKFIGDIEYGEKGVSMKNLYRLKQILGVGADFLFRRCGRRDLRRKGDQDPAGKYHGLLERVFCKAAWRHGTDRTTVCGRYRPG